MVDPLAEVVALLQPAAAVSKLVCAVAPWVVRRAQLSQPFYCAVLEGAARLVVDGRPPVRIEAGDFVLIPSANGFSISSPDIESPDSTPVSPITVLDGVVRVGGSDGAADYQALVGHCEFRSPDAALLVSLLPQLVHVRDEERLATLVRLVRDEWRGQRPARDMVLTRLLEVLLIEALRATSSPAASPGLLRGLADPRLAAAIRELHAHPARAWSVAQLAKAAALSRSAFFERFNRAVGVAPMAYLLAWRMALAKNLLRRREGGVAEIAERVGYASASTFSVSFSRHVGVAPARYARGETSVRVAAKKNGLDA
jgi:AraC-like DNA-binding protein